jgi:hypothetical protein
MEIDYRERKGLKYYFAYKSLIEGNWTRSQLCLSAKKRLWRPKASLILVDMVRLHEEASICYMQNVSFRNIINRTTKCP